MSGSGKDRSRRSKLLTDDDQALWSLVAESIGPVRGKPRVRDLEPDPQAIAPPEMQPPAPPKPPAARPRSIEEVLPRADIVPARREQRPPPAPKPVTLERRKARRIAKGTEEIEARLDLHGMTQEDAHAALLGFVRRCHAGGLRTVLVITGKGSPGRTADDAGADFMTRPRGVLRRNVPRWLAGAEIGALVVSYAAAHVRHGGDGALYVRLRRKP